MLGETLGVLVLVVGASGVGKDTLMDGARARLAQNHRFVFPRRHITRPADAGGENHIEVTKEIFDETRAGGGYLLAWDAHGLGYGVPVTACEALEDGCVIVVNTSRTVLDDARALGTTLRVLHVTAPPKMIRARLAGRGRESDAQVEARVARAQAVTVSGPNVIDIRNDGNIDAGISRFVSVLQDCANGK